MTARTLNTADCSQISFLHVPYQVASPAQPEALRWESASHHPVSENELCSGRITYQKGNFLSYSLPLTVPLEVCCIDVVQYCKQTFPSIAFIRGDITLLV